MNLAIFDLDNTLLAGDSDYLWGQFLVESGRVDGAEYAAANARFYSEYKNGTLDIREFLEFALAPLARHDMATLHAWREQFVNEKIRPILLRAAVELIEAHRAAGHVLLIITATNHFVTSPIAALYGIEHLIATTPAIENGRYTGSFTGIPCFQAGKVERLAEWLKGKECDLTKSWFYSDSHNDLPLLEQVGNAVAVDPDETLAGCASERNWPIISLRNNRCPEAHLALIGT